MAFPIGNAIDLAELSANPTAPAVTATRVFAKPDNNVYTEDSNSIVSLIGSPNVQLEPVKAAAPNTDITLSGTQTIDGVACVAGDRVLARGQVTGSQNGIYIVAAGAWTRAPDANTVAKMQRGASVYVMNGTQHKGKTFTQHNTLTTLGTDVPYWRVLTFVDLGSPFALPPAQGAGQVFYNQNAKALVAWDGVAWQDLNGTFIATSLTRPGFVAPGTMVFETDTLVTSVWDGSGWKAVSNTAQRYVALNPTTAAGANWVITHNLGSRDVFVQIRRNTSPYDFVDAYMEATDINTITVKPDVALPVAQYSAIVKY